MCDITKKYKNIFQQSSLHNPQDSKIFFIINPTAYIAENPDILFLLNQKTNDILSNKLAYNINKITRKSINSKIIFFIFLSLSYIISLYQSINKSKTYNKINRFSSIIDDKNSFVNVCRAKIYEVFINILTIK